MTMSRRSRTRRTTCPACRGASCGSAAMSALVVEVVVDDGAVHADGLGDLGDGVLPLAVRAGSFGVGLATEPFSYVKAVSARSGRVPAGVVSVRSGSGAARVWS